MPGYLLNADAIIHCSHGGQASPSMINPRVRVSGQPVVSQSDISMINGCPNASPGPCVSARWLTGSLRVKLMGKPVLLADSQSISSPTGTPLQVVATQVRVKGI